MGIRETYEVEIGAVVGTAYVIVHGQFVIVNVVAWIIY